MLHEEHAFSDLFLKFLLARSLRTQADLVDQLFNSSEKRLARVLLLMAEFGKPGEVQTLHLARFTKFGHQQQNPCQALLAGVEKLIDEISLSSHAAGKQKLQEQIGEGSLCSTRIISARSILRAVQPEIAVAVASRRPTAPAIDSSPTKSPAASSVIEPLCRFLK